MTQDPIRSRPRSRASTLPVAGFIWLAFLIASFLLLDVVGLTVWAIVVTALAAVLGVILTSNSHWRPSVDRGDLIAVAALYLAVVGLFRVAFVVFTDENVLGLFLMFAGGLIIGVLGPIVYQVWGRRRDLTSLGISRHHLAEALTLGLILSVIQFAVTLWGYDFPGPVDWVPLLVMSLVVGFFEAIFFRGFIQTRLEASFGTGPGIAGAALLYSVYHWGFGMGLEQMWFLFGLGVVYAIAFRLVDNVFVLWPLLTPLGVFFNNLQAGDIDLPWASIVGFGVIGLVMAAIVWLAHRKVRRRILTVAGPSSQLGSSPYGETSG